MSDEKIYIHNFGGVTTYTGTLDECRDDHCECRPASERDYHNPSVYSDLTLIANMWSILDDAGNLLIKKHEAYGPKNISQAPGGPENGLRVRMWDKMARLNHILDNPGVDVNDESLEDTLKDLLNYCAIFILVRRNQWPKGE